VFTYNGAKNICSVVKFNIDIKTQINTHISGGNLWCERGRQVVGLVVDVPGAPTHHTFDQLFVLLDAWCSLTMGQKTYVKLQSYIQRINSN
jgi:hypothetical protein